jgi:hypothetical protein
MIVLCGAIEQGADALLGHLDGSFYGLAQRRFEFGSGCASGHAASSRQAARRAQRPWVRAIFVLAQVSDKGEAASTEVVPPSSGRHCGK